MTMFGFVVPLDLDNVARIEAWSYVYGHLHVVGPVAIGCCLGAWSKGAAVADALEQTRPRDDDVLIVHDADVIVDDAALDQAIAAVTAGAGWAIPHQFVHRLDESSTRRFLDTGRVPDTPTYDRPPYPGLPGGGIVVLRAATYRDCPIDVRFHGYEDQAWGWALGCLHGPPARGDADLWHLWHPPARPPAKRSMEPSEAILWDAYRRSRRSPEQTRRIIAAGLAPE